MFIYAMYMNMRKAFPNTRLDLSDMAHYKVHYGYELHKVFNVPTDEFCINSYVKKVLEFLFFKTILERKQHGQLSVFRRSFRWPFIYFKGFYQSEIFFQDIKDEVRKAFTFDKGKANLLTHQLLRELDSTDHTVSIHVRRGDYLQDKHWASLGCICTPQYYMHAVEYIKQHVANPRFYVFSDEPEWIKQHLQLDNATYVDWNKAEDSWQDMMLMSHCRHNIICNSTFSWWGAWLNPNPNKIVIAPDKWNNAVRSDGIVPKEWIQQPTA